MKTLLLIAFLLAFVGLLTSVVFFFNLIKKQKLLNEENSKVELNYKDF